MSPTPANEPKRVHGGEDKQFLRGESCSTSQYCNIGPGFSIQIKLIETMERGGQQPTLYVYDYVVTENSTGKIYGGRGKNRLEASVADMHLPGRWQFKDLDGDRNIDFRYYKGDGRKSDFWWAEVWQAKNRRFLFGKEYSGQE